MQRPRFGASPVKPDGIHFLKRNLIRIILKVTLKKRCIDYDYRECYTPVLREKLAGSVNFTIIAIVSRGGYNRLERAI